MVAPSVGFKDPPTGGVRIGRIAELINDQASEYKFPLREAKDRSEGSLDNFDIDYTHMFDNRDGDNNPVLREPDSVLNIGPTLEELDEEMDRLEFTKDKAWTFTAEERANILLEEPVLTGGSSSSGTTGGGIQASSTSVKARVETIGRSLGLNRQNKPRHRPQPEDGLPGDPKWERIGDRVIRRYTGTNEPEGVWPEVWRGISHKERNILIKEVKEFREQHETSATTTEAPLEGVRPTDTGTGEGAWPGASAAQSAAPAGKQKEVVRHIVEFCTSENSKIGGMRYTKDGCSVMRCSLKDDVTTNKGLKRAFDGVRKPGYLLWASMPCIGGSPWQHINRHKPGGAKETRRSH